MCRAWFCGLHIGEIGALPLEQALCMVTHQFHSHTGFFGDLTRGFRLEELREDRAFMQGSSGFRVGQDRLVLLGLLFFSCPQSAQKTFQGSSPGPETVRLKP